MGGQSAQAMNIGTGGSQQDKYSSSYSTPNYTQYTNSDFKGEQYSTPIHIYIKLLLSFLMTLSILIMIIKGDF